MGVDLILASISARIAIIASVVAVRIIALNNEGLLCMLSMPVSYSAAPVLSRYVTYLTVETYIGHSETTRSDLNYFVLRHSFLCTRTLRTNHLFSSTPSYVRDDDIAKEFAYIFSS